MTSEADRLLYNGQNLDEVKQFVGEQAEGFDIERHHQRISGPIAIESLQAGDWIVRISKD